MLSLLVFLVRRDADALLSPEVALGLEVRLLDEAVLQVLGSPVHRVAGRTVPLEVTEHASLRLGVGILLIELNTPFVLDLIGTLFPINSRERNISLLVRKEEGWNCPLLLVFIPRGSLLDLKNIRVFK